MLSPLILPVCPSFLQKHWRTPSRPRLRSPGSRPLLCIAPTPKPVGIYQCLLLVAKAGEAMSAHDYTLAFPCVQGCSSLRTPGMYSDLWSGRVLKKPCHGQRRVKRNEGEIVFHNKPCCLHRCSALLWYISGVYCRKRLTQTSTD